jgi:dolichyl-phosphate-mannose--protein O-mannosyl transferase
MPAAAPASRSASAGAQVRATEGPRPPAAGRAIAVLVLLGALTHVVGLTYPRQVVFDEVHWGKAVNAYCCSGERIFDVHPPHGKLLLTLGAVLGRYDGSIAFQQIGESYRDQPVFFIRLVPALAGILIPPLFFLWLRNLGAAFPTALLGGLLLTFDNALLLETHVLLFDGILVAATLGSLVCLLAAERAPTRGRALTLQIAAGALAGLAAGTKFTGLVAAALIAIHLGVRVARARRELARRAVQFAVMAAAGGAVYLAGWAIHFALLQHPGPADAFHPTTGRFFEDLGVVHRTMMSANLTLAQTHPDASLPISWPWMKVPPYFWAGPGAALYLVGNPVVWWGSSLLLIAILVIAALTKVTNLRLRAIHPRPVTLWFPVVAYALAYLPLFGVRRVLFLYHYFTPLVFALTIALLWLQRAGWIRSDRIRDQHASYFGVIVALVVAFLLVSPLTYGYSFGTYDEWLVGVIRSWR